MKKFLLKAGLFFLCAIVFMSINLAINYHRLTDEILLPQETLIAGDSHLMTGINPAIIPNSVNVCSGAESYVMTFYKLKKLFRENPNVEKAFVGYSYHNLAVYQDLRLIGARAKSQFRRYYDFLPLSLPNQIRLNSTKFYHTYIRELALFPNNSPIRHMEGFKELPNEMVKATLKATLTKHFARDKQDNVRSYYAEQYLDSIVTLTQREGIELTLIGTPQHHDYLKEVPTELISWYDKLSKEFENKGVKVINRQVQSYPDSLYRDHDHLNKGGASRFSAEIVEALGLDQ